MKTVVTLMLDSTEAMVLWWGEDALQIYTVLLISRETTVRVLGERRRQTLNLLRRRLATVDGLAALDAAVRETVRLNPGDLPGATLSATGCCSTPRSGPRS